MKMKKLLLVLIALLMIGSFANGQLTEGFETWPPPGWTIVQGACSPTNDITQDATEFYSGAYSARFSSYSTCGTYDEYMVTPELETTAGDQTISFWYKQSFGTETFTVGWSSTGTDVNNDFTWSAEIADATTTWQPYSKTDLPVGTKYVAIHYYSNYQYYLYIDDVAGPALYIPPNPVLTVSPGSPYDFGYVQVGNSAIQTFTVTNIGGGIAEITGAAIVGSTDFAITASTFGFLPPGPVTIEVTYTPSALGAATATLEIYDDTKGLITIALDASAVGEVGNDECGDAVAIYVFPQTVTGTTKGAEIDCPGVLDWGAVWYEVELPYALNDLSASYCGTATPPMYTGGIVYLPDCASCASYVIADYYGFDACTVPEDNTLQMNWDAVPGPTTIMFPAYAADANDLGVDFTLTFDVIDASVVVPGTDCANPIVIGSLGYTTSDNTSLYGDDYESVDEICSASSYLNGDDVVYSYTPAADECIDITLTNTGTWVGLFVYEGCAPFTTCVGVDTQSGGNPSLSGVSLTGGIEYFIVISSWPSPQSIAYDLEIVNCPDCPAPTNQTESNITSVGSDLNWDFMVDSFFDIFIVPEFDPPPGPGTIPTIPNVPGNSVTWDGGTPSTSYDWYVRTDCEITLTSPVIDYFWMAMDDVNDIVPGLSGGLPLDDLGEDGIWWEYPLAPDPWWNIWFYNGPLDIDNMKLVTYGFWIQSYNGIDPGELNYVINWSNDLWVGPGFPTPLDEIFIERSPINGPIVITPGIPQWIELTYLIEDYCPEWVSIDLWGENIQILEIGDPPPVGSPLFDWWVPGSPGGILAHECLPDPIGNNSTWTGPSTFTTLAPPPANDLCVNAIDVTCGNQYPGTTAAATNSAIPDCQTYPNTAPDVWYHFVGTGQMVSADLCTNTSYDTRMSVFEGDCANLICVDGNDDYCGLYSRVDWFATLGYDYYIMVHGYNTSSGAFELNIDCTDPATATWIGGDPSYLDGNPLEDWFGADNWDVQDVPGVTTNVTLPAGLTYYPTIDREARSNDLAMSSDASGTATILGNGNLIAGGTATVQRYYATGGTTFDEWHLISAPISNAQSGIYDTYFLQWYEEGLDTWHDIEPLTDPMTSLQGFAFYSPTDMMTFDYMGTLGDGAYGLPISAFGPDPYHWNLFGNPYPSSLDWDLVVVPNLANLQSGAVYYLDQATGNYVSYNGGLGGGVQYVPPGQGFFVSGAIDMAPFVVDNSMRTHMGGSAYYKTEFDNLLVLEATGNELTDATYLRFDENASEELDQMDAFKLLTVSNPNLPQLYTIAGDKMSINVLPETTMVPAGFKAGVEGVYTISIKEVAGMANVVLEDVLMNTQTDLINNTYTFNYNVDDADNRFIIHFTPLGIGDNAADLINIYSSEKDVYVTVPANTKGDIFVYNIMGQEIARSTITDVVNKITLSNSAYYVVKVISDGEMVTKKVFVK